MNYSTHDSRLVGQIALEAAIYRARQCDGPDADPGVWFLLNFRALMSPWLDDEGYAMLRRAYVRLSEISA